MEISWSARLLPKDYFHDDNDNKKRINWKTDFFLELLENGTNITETTANQTG